MSSVTDLPSLVVISIVLSVMFVTLPTRRVEPSPFSWTTSSWDLSCGAAARRARISAATMGTPGRSERPPPDLDTTPEKRRFRQPCRVYAHGVRPPHRVHRHRAARKQG